MRRPGRTVQALHTKGMLATNIAYWMVPVRLLYQRKL